jgi:hypothetical protein
MTEPSRDIESRMREYSGNFCLLRAAASSIETLESLGRTRFHNRKDKLQSIPQRSSELTCRTEQGHGLRGETRREGSFFEDCQFVQRRTSSSHSWVCQPYVVLVQAGGYVDAFARVESISSSLASEAIDARMIDVVEVVDIHTVDGIAIVIGIVDGRHGCNHVTGIEMAVSHDLTGWTDHRTVENVGKISESGPKSIVSTFVLPLSD